MSVKSNSWNSESFHSADSKSSQNSKDLNVKEASKEGIPNENLNPALIELNEFSTEQFDNTPILSSPLTKTTKNSFPPKRSVQSETL